MTINLLSMFRNAGPPIANHLWQSTAFVAAIGLLTVLFAKNRARVRYGFSMLIALGGVIPISKHPIPVLQTALVSALRVVDQPFSGGAVIER